jgi:hypothetical protein
MGIRDIDWRAKGRRVYGWGMKVPPVLRTVLGLGLIVAGFLGIVLPLLGFWMAPLGLLLIALDIAPLRARAERWLEVSR